MMAVETTLRRITYAIGNAQGVMFGQHSTGELFLDDISGSGGSIGAYGVDSGSIIRLGSKDNFWSMGVPGPCGPCSEILIDRGPAYGADRDWEAGDRYMEFWNLVFMQNIRGEGPGKEGYPIVGDLPAKNIDTGLGLERVAYLLQGVDNMYEIDEVFPVIARASEWWDRHIVADVPPAPTCDSDIKRLYPSDNGTVVEANPKSLELIARAIELREQIAALEAELEGDKKAGSIGVIGSLKAYMGEAQRLVLGADDLITWKTSKPAQRFDSKAFQAAHPELYPQFLKTGEPVRRFLIKE